MRAAPATPQRWHVFRAAEIIRCGGVVAYPTEAVFGLGCDPLNAEAARRLLALKRRPASKGLILIAAEFAQLRPYLGELSDAMRRRIGKTWPGHVTWLLPAHPELPRWIRGAHSSVAVRVTAHPVAAALCRAADSALISTSANVAGRAPARTTLDVRRQFRDSLDYILPGATGPFTAPSEIRDGATGKVIRPGG
ncbi:MAG TPA: tRNA threonylcarbamoyladenosine biosynthesis protein RimN [Chromatiales bacterium]|nr:tRNA threonylcarbamoyladenosine biosynthesis protein RimN [Chromatiales bacterium]